LENLIPKQVEDIQMFGCLLACLCRFVILQCIQYTFMLKNEILPLPCVQTIKRHLSLVKLDFGFDPAFFEMFKKKINLKT